MKEKTLGIILGVLNLILIVVCVTFFLGKDKTAPVLTIEPVAYVYEEDLPESILYQGVSAYDGEDGDVTETIVIEKVVTDRTQGKATITYGACDTSGNVGKATRTLDMPVLTLIQFPGAGEADVNTKPQTTVPEVSEGAEAVTEETEAENTETAEENVADEEADNAETTEENEATEETTEGQGETTDDADGEEDAENEGEGTTGGNVTVVGSNNRRN